MSCENCKYLMPCWKCKFNETCSNQSIEDYCCVYPIGDRAGYVGNAFHGFFSIGCHLKEVTQETTTEQV